MIIILQASPTLVRAVDRARRALPFGLAAIVGLLVLDVVLLLSGPPWAGFSGVVGTACGWCLWLEKASTAGVRRFG